MQYFIAAFSWSRISNWKDGLAKIRSHAKSEHNKQANEALFILPKQTKDIGEQLDPSHTISLLTK